MNDQYWWVAVNGASVAASMMPASVRVNVSPVPQQLFGFRTQKEQLAAQKFFLNEPIAQVKQFLDGEIKRKILSGQVMYIRPDNPEPPTNGQTAWYDSRLPEEDKAIDKAITDELSEWSHAVQDGPHRFRGAFNKPQQRGNKQ